MKPKTVFETRSGMAAANVVEGKAELAFTLISEILLIAGAELAGPLPPDLQDTSSSPPAYRPASGTRRRRRL